MREAIEREIAYLERERYIHSKSRWNMLKREDERQFHRGMETAYETAIDRLKEVLANHE